MDYLLILGNRIRERRTALGISQAELAEAAGYSQKGMISRGEHRPGRKIEIKKTTTMRHLKYCCIQTEKWSSRYSVVPIILSELPQSCP